MKAAFYVVFGIAPLSWAGDAAVQLPDLIVSSPRIANQIPAGTFAMPVSSLRYEPQVDLQSRNLSEGQADVTLRGGIFENTGFRLGAVTLTDPQTGHYFAEIPVAPAMLGESVIYTGSDLTLSATNATTGSLAYGWRPIRTTGVFRVGAGSDRLHREELYQGVADGPRFGPGRLAADVALAHSASRGAVPFGEHRFDRANLRVQLAGGGSQTDLFAGYQAKFFGWPNLYTPFNSRVTEDLETVLVAANHRATLVDGSYFEAGAYHRRNKDDYAFNRFATVGPVHPFQHTTWVTGGAVSGRRQFGNVAVNLRGEVLADEIVSTSLNFGRYRTRRLTKFAVVPERRWSVSNGEWVLKAGAAYDDSNRGSGAVSPSVEIAREFSSGAVRRLQASYARTTQLPTYTALNSNPAAGLFRGNPNLGRQSSHNVEFGVEATLGGWATRAAVFWRADDALVDWTFRRGVTARTANAVDIAVTGFELLARRSWTNWDVVLGYTGLSKDHNYRGALVDASFYALNYARHRLTAALTGRLGRGFEVRLDNAARIQAANLLRVAGGEEALSTSFGLSWRPEGLPRTEFSVRVENVWDSRFQEVPAVPASPRQFSAGVAYHW